MTQEVRNLGELLDRIGSRAGEDRDRISLGMILETVGSRSFAAPVGRHPVVALEWNSGHAYDHGNTRFFIRYQ